MKRIFLLICCVILSCLSFTACVNENAKSTVSYSFSVNIDEKTLEVGDVFQIRAAYGEEKLSYSSGNENVAKVSESGKIEAIGSGVAYITISVEGFSEKYLCEITVVKPQYLISFVDEGDYKVFVNATKNLRVITLKDGQQYDDTLIFTVNSDSASVENTKDGCVFKALEQGTYEITAKSSKGGVATITITVINE